MKKNNINSYRKQFLYYKSFGDKSFLQLSDEDLFWKMNKESNSIANIVQHLWGNMLSRWTDFLTFDGEKEWRERDLEFEDVIESRIEMLKKWEEGWDCLLNALNQLNPSQLENIIYIRNQGHTVLEALNRQMAHYAYHIGQIVYIGKSLEGEDWNTLSIPKGKSKSYNEAKFSKPKERSHYTNEFLANKRDS